MRERLLQCLYLECLYRGETVEEEMNDQDRTRERDHWQAIAEQLGLAPESERPETSADERAQIAHHVEPPPAQIELAAEAKAAIEPREMPTETKNQIEAALCPPVPTGENTDEGAVENEPKRRAPRGRRKRGSDSSKSARHSAERAPGREKESAATSKRRDKGRGRKKQSNRAVEDKLEPDQVLPAGSEEPDNDDEGYGNWTVPSWSELISSLYRPER